MKRGGEGGSGGVRGEDEDQSYTINASERETASAFRM